jgi:hypothetical protein
MVSFLEVVPNVAQVELASIKGKVDVPGISIEGLARLFMDNPDVANVFTGGGFDPDKVEDLAALGSKFISEFLAAGLGYPGNEDAIEKCKMLPPGDVWELGETIINVSFPGGAKNFLEKVTAAGNQMAAGISGDSVQKPITGEVKSKGRKKASKKA